MEGSRNGIKRIQCRSGTGGVRILGQRLQIVRAFEEQSKAGVGVFTVDGKMIDVAFIPGARRTLRLAKACGMYEGDLV